MSATGGSSEGRATTGRPPLLVELRGVVKCFGSVVALDHVGLRVRAGAVVGLVGPNGSGKTTALGIVSGLLTPDAGSAAVAGAPAGSRRARTASALVPAQPEGFDELTIAEYAALIARLYLVADPEPRHAALFDAFGLGDRRHDRLGTLSTGLRRQASLVAALGLMTPVVLIDEATAALDPEAVVVLRSILRVRAEQGAAVLLATQDLRFAETTCDIVVMLSAGIVVAYGAPARMLDRLGASDLEEAFLVATGRRTLEEDVRARLARL